MAKGKYFWLVAMLVTGYIAWVAVSGFLTNATGFASSVHEQKVTRMKNLGLVDSVIVGGSNAVYSLSAERLSRLSGQTWFNAALPREGFTQENLTSFLDDFADSVDVERISTVVVSSAHHWHAPRRELRADHDLGFDGIKVSPFWLPSQSLWTLVSEPPAKIFPPIITAFGDLIHDATDLCEPDQRAGNREWATNHEIDLLVESWLPLVHSRFPAAAVVMTIPSRFVVEPTDPEATEDYRNRLQSRIDAWIGEHPEAVGMDISTIIETNYDDPALLCTTGLHFNAVGRQLRTDALYAVMVGQGVSGGR